MDGPNDIVHPDGKIGRGGMAAQVEAGRVLQHIAELRRAARDAGVRIIYVRVALRSDYADLLSGSPRFQQLKALDALQDGTWGRDSP